MISRPSDIHTTDEPLEPLCGVTAEVLALLQRRLSRTEPRRGRPWALSLPRRVLVVCIGLRTNLTVRELAAVFAISKSQAHRILDNLTTRIAELFACVVGDRRRTWIVDGTLIPTRDHAGCEVEELPLVL